MRLSHISACLRPTHRETKALDCVVFSLRFRANTSGHLTHQNEIKILDPNSGLKSFTVPSHAAPHAALRELAYIPDGRQLATPSIDSTNRVWDVATGPCRLTMSGHADEVFALAFHPDGTRLASVATVCFISEYRADEMAVSGWGVLRGGCVPGREALPGRHYRGGTTGREELTRFFRAVE